MRKGPFNRSRKYTSNKKAVSGCWPTQPWVYKCQNFLVTHFFRLLLCKLATKSALSRIGLVKLWCLLYMHLYRETGAVQKKKKQVQLIRIVHNPGSSCFSLPIRLSHLRFFPFQTIHFVLSQVPWGSDGRSGLSPPTSKLKTDLQSRINSCWM